MTIRPVVLNGMIQRTDDIGQLKQHEDAKPAVDQQNIQMQVQRAEHQSQKQVNKAENSQLMDERFDAKEEGKGQYRDNRKKNPSKKKEDGHVGAKKPVGNFDIKI